MFILLLPLLQQNEVTDSAYLGSESTYSECETFTDEDTGALVPPEMHEDVETDSGIEATLHDPEDGGNRSVSISPLTAIYTMPTLANMLLFPGYTVRRPSYLCLTLRMLVSTHNFCHTS